MVRCQGVKCVKMELGEPDASGRRRPIPIKDSEFVIPADTMIAAVAQAPEISFLEETHGLEVTPKGTFAVDPLTLATNRPGVFAGGDVARGPWILIQAIADGRRGALSIDRYLRGVDLLTPREQIPLPVVDLSQEEIDQMVEEGKVDLAPRTTVPSYQRKRGSEISGKWSWSLPRNRQSRRQHAVLPAASVRNAISVSRSANGRQSIISRPMCGGIGSGVRDPLTGLHPLQSGTLARAWAMAGIPMSSRAWNLKGCSAPPVRGEAISPGRSDHREPKKIAFLQCVGSREKEHDLLQLVCCMYATKEAMLAMEHIPRGGIKIFQMDMRAFGKGFRCLLRKGEGERDSVYSLPDFRIGRGSGDERHPHPIQESSEGGRP